MLPVLVLIVTLAMLFDFINGFHDTANAVATSVSTRALSPRTAIVYAAGLNFAGAVASSGVAQTIGGGIANPAVMPHGTEIVTAALISAILWNLLTWYYGIPSSSSHTLIGSMAGAVVAGAGPEFLKWEGFSKIILILILSPIAAFIAGVIVTAVLRYVIGLVGSKSRTRLSRIFKMFQIASAGLVSFSHGGNDAQKAMGIIVFGLVAADVQPDMNVPLWVKAGAAAAMALGTSVGGWRIIDTVGTKIVKLEPESGFASDLASFIVIQTSTALKMPLSTTHVVSSAIIGTGSVIRLGEIRWSTVVKNAAHMDHYHSGFRCPVLSGI